MKNIQSTFAMLEFFLKYYDNHRDLHSFPTRRSSDLLGRARLDDAHALRANRRGETGARVDRKSTRLNSSHVEISYAVFRLKKKKIMEDPILVLIDTLADNFLIVHPVINDVKTKVTFP